MYRDDLVAATARLDILERELARRDDNAKEVSKLRRMVTSLRNDRLPQHIKSLNWGMAAGAVGAGYFILSLALAGVVSGDRAPPLATAVGLPVLEPLVFWGLLIGLRAFSRHTFDSAAPLGVPVALFVIGKLAPLTAIPPHVAQSVAAYCAVAAYGSVGYVFLRAPSIPLALRVGAFLPALGAGLARAVMIINDAHWTIGVASYLQPHNEVPAQWLGLYNEGATPLMAAFFLLGASVCVAAAHAFNRVKTELEVRLWEL